MKHITVQWARAGAGHMGLNLQMIHVHLDGNLAIAKDGTTENVACAMFRFKNSCCLSFFPITSGKLSASFWLYYTWSHSTSTIKRVPVTQPYTRPTSVDPVFRMGPHHSTHHDEGGIYGDDVGIAGGEVARSMTFLIIFGLPSSGV